MIQKYLYNGTDSKVQLQDTFTAEQMSLIANDDTTAPAGFPTIYAYEYRGKIILETLMGVHMKTINPLKIGV